MGKKLLFVNLSKNSHLINLTAAEAERYGHSVYNLMDFPKPTHRTLKHVEYCRPNINDYKQVINRLVSRHQIDYVLTQCDNLYPLLDSLDENIKVIPTITKCKVNELTDKQKFYNFCLRHGVPQPHSIVANSIDEIMSEFHGEIFVKPTNGADGTVRLYMTEEKYSQFDYMKYKNPKQFIDLMEKYNAIDDFLDVQKNGREMKVGKGLSGIRGKHMVQECVDSRNHFALNTIVADNQIKFTVIQKTQLPRDICIYFLSYPHTEQYIIDKRLDNYGTVKNILGKNIFKQAIEQMYRIINSAGMRLGIFSVSMVSMESGQIYLFDPHLRIGGGMAREIKTDSNEKKDEYFRRTLFKDIEIHSIWEYV